MFSRALSPVRRKILDELMEADLTAYDLECRCFISLGNMRRYLKLLHAEGAIHIVRWHRSAPQGPPVPVWGYGRGTDTPKPPALPRVQVRRNHRAKPGVKENEAARKRAKRAQDKVLNQPYTLADMALGKSLIRR